MCFLRLLAISAKATDVAKIAFVAVAECLKNISLIRTPSNWTTKGIREGNSQKRNCRLDGHVVSLFPRGNWYGRKKERGRREEEKERKRKYRARDMRDNFLIRLFALLFGFNRISRRNWYKLTCARSSVSFASQGGRIRKFVITCRNFGEPGFPRERPRGS